MPSLDLVSERLAPITGFRYVPAAGLVPLREFYGSLSERLFLDPVRSPSRGAALHARAGIIIHEVLGHGHLLATPTFSKLHHLTGEATHRLRDEENLLLSRVFWFTVEFGVVIEDGELRAYGADILSSYGEIDEFRDMELRPMDLIEMGTADYDITHYQPVLYRAESLDEVREVVGASSPRARTSRSRRCGRGQGRSAPERHGRLHTGLERGRLAARRAGRAGRRAPGRRRARGR